MFNSKFKIMKAIIDYTNEDLTGIYTLYWENDEEPIAKDTNVDSLIEFAKAYYVEQIIIL